MEEREFIAAPEDVGARLDGFLAEALEGWTRSGVQRLCEENCVRVQGKAVAKNYRLRLGDVVTVQIPETRALETEPEEIPLDLLFEDEDLLVVNKSKGMVVHPAPGNESGTLVNALLYHCGESLSGIGGVARPGIVHRIDKDTSGLLVVAKTDLAHTGLAAQMKAHSVTRRYHAVVYGRVKEEQGTIDAPIGRHPRDRKRMCVTDRNARQAVTHYRVLEQLDGFTHLLNQLETGRTHQIRVHMAYIGHPVAGDPVYGPKKVITSLDGQCLHARVLGFIHPRTGEYMEFDSGLPTYFSAFLDKHRRRD